METEQPSPPVIDQPSSDRNRPLSKAQGWFGFWAFMISVALLWLIGQTISFVIYKPGRESERETVQQVLTVFPFLASLGAVHGVYRLIFRGSKTRTGVSVPFNYPVETGRPVIAVVPVTAGSLLSEYAEESRVLSRDIYRRAGVYLLVGIVIAGAGLLFFYYMSNASAITLTAQNPTLSDFIYSEIGPRIPTFGALFFIEFIALYFLRQFRFSMDDFRYYEAIARNREENLVLLKLAEEREDKLPVLDLVKGSNFYSGAERLSKDETTDILEPKKLQKDELDLLSQVVQAIKGGR